MIRYSYVLMLGMFFNAAASFWWPIKDGTYTIAGAVMFTGYCVIKSLETKKK